VLQIVESGATYDINLGRSQSFAGDYFHLSPDEGAGTFVTEDQTPCFCRGVMILTPAGEAPVERLRVGDRVVTMAGEEKPITWIGQGRRRITRPDSNARPVIVRRDALADGSPKRDLRLTRGHSLYLDGMLIPVEFLINGHSIRWDDVARAVEFYHVELAEHDVLIADGAPTESYREDGNRELFENPESPRFTTADTLWFAPVTTGGPRLDRIWRRLLDRPGSSSRQRPTIPTCISLRTGDGSIRLRSSTVRTASKGFTVFACGSHPRRFASHRAAWCRS
jgi:hypothetical protein